MSTPLELGAVEAIKRGHRQARELVLRLYEANTTEERDAAADEFVRLGELMSALTGMTEAALMRAAITRLAKDGRIRRESIPA